MSEELLSIQTVIPQLSIPQIACLSSHDDTEQSCCSNSDRVVAIDVVGDSSEVVGGVAMKQAQSQTRASIPIIANPEAGGEGSFDAAVASGATAVVFDSSHSTYNYTDGLTTTAELDVIGNGVDGTTLAGGNLYLAGHTTSFSDITLNGQVFGGGTASSGITVTQEINLSFSDMDFASGKRIYGGAEVSVKATAVSGNITICMDDVDGNGARIFGAGKVADKAVMSLSNIDITISCAEGGLFSNLFAGADVAAEFKGTILCDMVNTTINSGTFTYCGNGSQLKSGSSVQKHSTLTINGGTFNHYVYAGGFSAGGTVSVNGNTTLIINSGTFATHVFGGCGANNSNNGGKTLISGTAGIVVNTSVNKVQFGGSVFAGSLGYGNIHGGTSLTFTGLGSNLVFAMDSYITGNSQMFRGSAQFVGGNQTLEFDGFTGNFGASVNNGFSRLVAKGSNVSFTGNQVVVGDISQWEIEVGSAEAELVFANGKNNFKGDTLTLTLADGAAPPADGWNVISGTTAALTGWKSFSSVSLCGKDATYANGEWSTDSYRLFKYGNTLKLASRA